MEQDRINILAYHAAYRVHCTDDLDAALDACADAARLLGASPDQVFVAVAYYRNLVSTWQGYQDQTV